MEYARAAVFSDDLAVEELPDRWGYDFEQSKFWSPEMRFSFLIAAAPWLAALVLALVF